MFSFTTLQTTLDDGVLAVRIDAPPINLIGPDLVRDLAGLIRALPDEPGVRVVVFESADPDFFIPHVDLTKVPEYTAEAGKAGGPGDAALGLLFRTLSQVPPVTIAKVRGRARGAGSEFVLACDLSFASAETAVFSQIEVGTGAPPGAGGVRHLARKLGRGRALEAILGAADFDAPLAERYGWINRALPDADLDSFVTALARRIASFPPAGVRAAKHVVNDLTLPGEDEFRADAQRFQQLVATPEAQSRIRALLAEGLQTRGPAELELPSHIASLPAAEA